MGIARKSVLGFVGQVYMLVVGLLSTILIARLLGPEGKGVLAVVAAIPSLALGLASLGLGPALAFLAGKDRYPARQLVTAAVIWSFVIGGLVGGLVWVSRAPLLDSVLKGLSTPELVMVCLSLPTYYLSAFMGALFTGHGRAVAVAAIQSTSATLNLVAVVLASVLRPGSSEAVVLGLSLSSVLVAGLSVLVYRAGFTLSFADVARLTREAVPYAAKSYVGQATTMFFLRADVFFLNYFAGPSAVGVYSVATNLAEKLWLLSAPVSNAVFGQITGSEKRDAVRLTTLTSRALLLLNGTAALLLLLIAIPLVPVIYGGNFAGAVIYLGLLLPGVVVYAVCQPYSQFFVGQLGRPGIISALSAGMMALSAVLYVTLIPVLGPTGAALGSTISYSSALFGYLWLMPRAAQVGPREMLVPTRGDGQLYLSVLRSAGNRLSERVRRR